jgi:DNA-directed RNA polymerase subunit L
MEGENYTLLSPLVEVISTLDSDNIKKQAQNLLKPPLN